MNITVRIVAKERGTTIDPLVFALQRLRRRLAVQQWILLTGESLFFSCVANGLWVVLTRLFPFLGDPLPFCAASFGAGTLMAAALTIRRLPTLAEIALRVDRRALLKERLVSSLQLVEDTSPMAQALHLDARQHLKALDLTRLFVFTPSPLMKLAVVPLLCFGLTAWLMPEIDVMGFRQEQQQRIAEKQLAQAHSKRIQSVADALKVPKTKETEDLTKAATGILRVAEDVKSGKINDKVAFSRLNGIEQDLQRMRSELGKKTGMPAGPIPGTSPSSESENPVEAEQRRLTEMAGKLQELLEKLGDGNLSEGDRKRIAREFGDLSTASRNADSPLGEALTKRLDGLRASLQAHDPRNLLAETRQAQNAVRDLQSTLNQLKMMDEASKSLRKAQTELMGEPRTCRICGKPLSHSEEADGMACRRGSEGSDICPTCFMLAGKEGLGDRQGAGMGGPGRGHGGTVGPLPDSAVTFNPITIPGQVSGNKALASVMQKGVPETNAPSKVEYVSGDFVIIRREAEKALTKEEIPPGSREFVRRYFGSFGQKSQE